MRHVVDEISHQVKDAWLVRIVTCTEPVVRDVTVVERMLTVGELPGHRCAQDQLCGAELDRVAEAPNRLTILQMRSEQVPHRIGIRSHQLLDELLDLGRNQRHLIRLLESDPAIGEFAHHPDADGIVE